MEGNIYSEQRCSVCGSKFRNNGKTGVVCPNHPNQFATKMEVIFRKIHKRFRVYEEAAQFLSGLRYKVVENTFDARDYQKDLPLSFTNQSKKWLETKKAKVLTGDLSESHYRNLKNYMSRACAFFGHKPVKDIGYADLEDFLLAQKDISDEATDNQKDISGKTRDNMRSCLNTFFTWLKKRKEIVDVPEFPETPYELGFRNITDKETQERIIEEVGRICPNKKVWLGILFLSTYISVRPNELLHLKWGQIDLKNGYMFFPHPKEKKPKPIRLIPERAVAQITVACMR